MDFQRWRRKAAAGRVSIVAAKASQMLREKMQNGWLT